VVVELEVVAIEVAEIADFRKVDSALFDVWAAENFAVKAAENLNLNVDGKLDAGVQILVGIVAADKPEEPVEREFDAAFGRAQPASGLPSEALD